MSTQDTPPELRLLSDLRITGSELAGFVQEKSGGLQCPICKTDESPVIHADSAEEWAHVIHAHIAWPLDRGARGDFKASCPNCGYAWYFDAAIVTEWVEKSRKDGDNGN